MERERALNPTAVQAIIIDGACLWGARQVKATLEKLRLGREVIILNRMDLPQPAASDTPVAALFVLCERLQIEPHQVLIVDHDHRRANLLRILGFKSAVLLNPGGHTRKLLSAGLLAEQDLESMGLFRLTCFTELVKLLQTPRRAFD